MDLYILFIYIYVAIFLVSQTDTFKWPNGRHTRQTTPAAVVIIETVATVSNVTFLDLDPWLVVLTQGSWKATHFNWGIKE